MSRYRTHHCGALRLSDVDTTVRLAGWLGTRRDHGNIMFLHVRDEEGVTQVVVDPDVIGHDTYADLARLQLESVLTIEGQVRARPEGQSNPELATGDVEVLGTSVDVLSAVTEPPPFLVDKGPEVGEELRLRYRYLDLRRHKMSEMLRQRDHLARVIREEFHRAGFLEVHTPVLSNSSPEGARDFLVPSRLHPGQFFALPQAPQQWKQLLIAGGVDRYFQIAPCFRDEAARADRSPGEFYQLDIEMAFVDQEDVFREVEALLTRIAGRCTTKTVPTPFSRLTFAEAIERYGSDKPDLRFGLEFRTLTDSFRDSAVDFLRRAVADGGAVRAIVVPGEAARFSRRDIDDFTQLVREAGVSGLAWLAWDGEDARGSLAAPMPQEEQESLKQTLGAGAGDLVLLAAGPRRRVDVGLNAVRLEIGTRLGLRDPDVLHFAWITDFPMYERDEETGAIIFSHNPFSMPQGGLEALTTMDPLDVLGYQYDIVCNGVEISSGAIRNNDPATLYKAFEIAGYDRDTVREQFGHMIEAFELGCPPHGGIAPGFERLLMLFTGATPLREVVPFPKNQSCQDLMVGAPSEVDEVTLRELGLVVRPGVASGAAS
jgi:aspartyl-tRNA synthetase